MSFPLVVSPVFDLGSLLLVPFVLLAFDGVEVAGPLPFSTVPDDGSPAGNGTSELPVRSDLEPPFDPEASG